LADRCAHHPDRDATARCASCGSAVCSTCLLPAQGRCRPCEEQGRALGEGLSIGAVLRAGLLLWRSAIIPVAIISTGFAAPYAFADGVADRFKLDVLESMQVKGVVQLFLGLVGTVAVARLYVLCDRGAPLRLGPALVFALRRWSAAVAVSLIAGLIVSVGLFLLVVPGLIAAINFCLAVPLLAATELDPNQVLRRSRALVLGERFKLFGPLAIAWVASAGLECGLEYGANRLGERLGDPALSLLVDYVLEIAVGMLDAAFLAVLVAVFARIARRGDAVVQGLGNQLA
jgi:hypothetical protein